LNQQVRRNTLATDKPEEACGIFGIFAPGEETARLTYFGLHALQHRGQESAGIAVSDGKHIHMHKEMGLVPQVFDEHVLSSLTGHIAVGHTRYSTTGTTDKRNAQPVAKSHAGGDFVVAHNGNLINTKQLRDEMEQKGISFSSTTDTEVIANLIAHFDGTDLTNAIAETMKLIRGAYSVVLMSEKKLFAFRDAYGIRPLVIGELPAGHLGFHAGGGGLPHHDHILHLAEGVGFDLAGAVTGRPHQRDHFIKMVDILVGQQFAARAIRLEFAGLLAVEIVLRGQSAGEAAGDGC